MIVPTVLNIILNVVLIPAFGLMGAVYATLASYGAGVVLLGAVGRRHVALPIPIGDTLKVGIAALAMWPVLSILPEWGSWAELFLKAGFGGLTYLVVALAINAAQSRTLLMRRLADRKAAASLTESETL